MTNRRNYDEFAKAFTASRFPRADLTDGQAMMSHDSALTAIMAARQDSLATTDPGTVGA